MEWLSKLHIGLSQQLKGKGSCTDLKFGINYDKDSTQTSREASNLVEMVVH